jgi:DNA-binding XRE family transcriptional regulator
MKKYVSEGHKAYEEYWTKQYADPEFRRISEEEAPKFDLWLALADAREASGLTRAQVAERMGVSQGQVARIENPGNEPYSLRTLRRYIRALGDGFKLNITISTPSGEELGVPIPNRFVTTQTPVK